MISRVTDNALFHCRRTDILQQNYHDQNGLCKYSGALQPVSCSLFVVATELNEINTRQETTEHPDLFPIYPIQMLTRRNDQHRDRNRGQQPELTGR